MPYAGFDVASCPPMRAMQWLWDNTNLYWVGFYLPVAGAGLKDKLTWKTKFAPLRAMGWGIAPLYVGKQRNSLKLKAIPGRERFNGYLDGMEAAQMARDEGIPLTSVIYFDFEGGNAPTNAWKQYFYGWCEAVGQQLYYPGLYISHTLAKPQLIDDITDNTSAFGLFGRPEIWGINIEVVRKNGAVFDTPKPGQTVHFPENEPADSKASEATSWQHSYYCTVYWMDEIDPKHPVKRAIHPVDLDTSIYKDPARAFTPVL